MARSSKYPGLFIRPVTDEPSPRGEWLVCLFRFVIFGLGIAYAVGYQMVTRGQTVTEITPMISIASAWIIVNTALFLAMWRGYYKWWMSSISTAMDMLVVVLLQLMSAHTFVFNFSTNLICGLYFVAICLSAMRQSVLHVFLSGMLSAFFYLTVELYFLFHLNLSTKTLLLYNGRVVASVEVLDQVVKAIAMGITGWLIGHMTAQIRNTQTRYQTLLEQVPDGLLLTNREGAIQAVNRSFAAMAGVDAGNLVGRQVNSLFDGEMSFESRLKQSRDNIPVTISRSSFHEEDTRRIVSVRDLSGRRALEHQLDQMPKFEALSQLAQGLAHDFNNLLGGIIGSAGLLSRQMLKLSAENVDYKVSTQLNEHAERILSSADNARSILKRLLSMGKQHSDHFSDVDLIPLLNSLKAILSKTSGFKYEFRMAIYTRRKAIVKGTESALFQALLNICMNAKESMPDGGLVEITLRRREPRGGKPASKVQTPHFWVIQIVDHGRGMTSEERRQCVEPFFTTKKKMEQGMGLGLPIASSIIARHGGVVEIQSRRGSGTMVEICLPGKGEPEDVDGR